MFGIRRKTQPAAQPPTQPSAAKANPIFEHRAEFTRHQARTHGVTQRHKVLLASTLASPPALANTLPTEAPRRTMNSMVAGSPAVRPTEDEPSVAPVAVPDAAAGEASWDSSSRA
jgi:hypothetical protein